MGHYMGTAAERGEYAAGQNVGNHVYELRGVLLHKGACGEFSSDLTLKLCTGASAYHGHYEAQVFDVTYVCSRVFAHAEYTYQVQTTSMVSVQ
jgi:hypothetical protein